MSNLKEEQTYQSCENDITNEKSTLSNEKNSKETILKKKITKKVSFHLDEDETNEKKEDMQINDSYFKGYQIGEISHASSDNGGQHYCRENDYIQNATKVVDENLDSFMKNSSAKCTGDRISEYNCWMKENVPNGNSGISNEHMIPYNQDIEDKLFTNQDNLHKLPSPQNNLNEYKNKEKEPIYTKYDKREYLGNEKNGMLLKDELTEDEGDQTISHKKNGKKEKKIEIKTEDTNFEKSYNESLNNYNSSSFVDILNSIQGNLNGTPNGNINGILNGNINGILNGNINGIRNGNVNGTRSGSAQNEYTPNGFHINGENKMKSINYENVDFTENVECNNLQLIACIHCGDSIKANASKMCSNCILQNVESSSININKDTYLIYYCRECKRYLHNRWVYCELESKELLALCLKKVNKLKKLKILDAKFLYTEPHSKRIKIHLSVQEELINNFISEMELILHYVIKYTQCDDCKKKYTPYTYNTCVSVRQKVEHKKTLLFLESLLLKCNMNENIINIVSNPDGLDFHFLSRTDALKFCDFILSKTMSKCKNSKHLINHDANNNTYNYLYSFSIDICPICKYDLIFFPKDLSIKYGIKSTFYLCIHVSIFIILINPFCSSNNVHISQERYNKHPFLPLLSKADSRVFLILNVEYIDNDSYSKNECKNGVVNGKLRGNSNGNAHHDGNIKVNGNMRGAQKGRGEIKEMEEWDSNLPNDKNNNLKRKTKSSTNTNNIVYDSSDDDYQLNDYNNSQADTKSCKSSTRKVKLDKLVYAYVELYDESEGNTILTKTCNAKHLKPGDYVNAYDLRKHTFDNDISLYLEKDDNYSIIIIDKVKSKERQKIENELQVQNNNIETMKNINDEDIFKRILLNNCRDMENITIH
ncbi:60S ribosomal export protein NMD3 [Plasmodium gonderi]|uniref:60S ribosomal export protein NMD3 n=1 Tax=Plasmodium gonderi TaxID=77519 RepID=A0A1Y1JD79_PLAGO|nr:60S ribosomal export protein NMD3 [Plasmodium gonderi]GAW79177.1 60S ribosomal export protein NMD3 [Plasmodium gonderi]